LSDDAVPLIIVVVQLNTKAADSSILAIFNLCLALSGLALLRSSYSAWLIAVCWVLLPPLLLATLFFWAGDVTKSGIRKQAFIALLISLPGLAVEVWFFGQLKL
jgi:hypothetical protein